MNRVEIKAFAKLNLTLDIIGKREDGYHDIRSIFQAVDLFDLITLTKAKASSLTGVIIDNNIICKVKTALEQHIGQELPAEIHLSKSIPVAAGMGGGSSDAAAVLVGFNELFGLSLSTSDIIQIGLSAGSDVPYFLSNFGSAFVEGRGEIVKPGTIALPKFYAIARPHMRLSTAEMYKRYDICNKPFIEIAKELCPDVGMLESHFLKFTRDVGMSGSGPTVFAGFGSHGEGMSAIAPLAGFNGDIYLVRPVVKTREVSTSQALFTTSYFFED